MASARAMLERRRSSRVPFRIPIRVVNTEVDGQSFETTPIAVSRYGARIRVPFLPATGSRLEIRHGVSQEVREFRVISASPAKDGLFEVGLEIFHPTRNFWGIQFPGERPAA